MLVANLSSEPTAFDPRTHAVEVFRTTVASVAQATAVLDALHRACPSLRASFDLEDCDRVLCLRSLQPGPVRWDHPVAVVQALGVLVHPLPE